MTIRAAIAGVGEFGASFLFRHARADGLSVVAAADPDPNRIDRAAKLAGYASDQIQRCDSAAQAQLALQGGQFVSVPDATLLCSLAIDFIVEATGEPETAASIARDAIDAGINVAMVTKECDSVVGPILQRRAQRAGVVCTVVDGDQPSLTMGLVEWAQRLGLSVVCAGKASEYDFVVDQATETVTANARSQHLPGINQLWRSDARSVEQIVLQRAELMAAWPHRTTPDLCELCLMANATGFRPATPELHAPIARTLELPNLFRQKAAGGLLRSDESLDIFNCFRRSDEISFAGGVFVIVECDDPATWQVLKGKGIPMSDNASHALLHNPVHLLGLEAPISLMRATRSGQPRRFLTQHYDLVARASADLPAGHQLALGHRHSIPDLTPMLQPASAVSDQTPLPYYLAANRTLAEPIAAGEVLTGRHILKPASSTLWALRLEQDQLNEQGLN
ncbi:MAG: hypothetical protein AB8C46_00075 [Burkholderiaceae bacterium]